LNKIDNMQLIFPNSTVLVQLSIVESVGVCNEINLVTAAVPFAIGDVVEIDSLALINEYYVQCIYNAHVTQYWQDGSIKWCVIEFSCSWIKNKEKLFFLVNNLEKKIDKDNDIKVSENQNNININYLYGHYKIDVLLGQITNNSSIVYSIFPQLLGQNEVWKQCSAEWKYEIQHRDSSKAQIVLSNKYRNGTKKVKVKIIFTFRAYFPGMQITVSLHNQGAAEHKNGLWDLGDSGSVAFQRFSLEMVFSKGVKKELIENNKTQEIQEHLELVQYSSGGDNWKSTNHVLADGIVPFKHKGFRQDIDGKLITGKRNEAKIHLSNTKDGVLIDLAKFWQNFPVGYHIKNQTLSIDLFASVDYLHELQGGEQKTHNIWINPDIEGTIVSSEVIYATLSPVYIANTESFFMLNNHCSKEDIFSEIINLGLDSKRNFFEKRELIDEYGWRNFGDIYADHETIGEKGKNVKISHYNNQYDPLYGFIRQYVLSGNKKWFELADDLSQHIVDIDCYKTVLDRDEYNFGLFWHTDHYLDAKTSSHRSLSALHESAYEGYTRGGGPGGQHCYTTGLTLHYLITGTESSKQAVIDMAKWISYVFNGSDSLFATIFAIKKSGSHGAKNIITGSYPFDRGTANLMVTLLNAWHLTDDFSYIESVQTIILDSIHPLDNISDRGLDNIEKTWFYTVFLQALISYLQLKEQLSQLDSCFYYARDSLLHYASWMLLNESPYLDKAEQLEFPNNTWTAQDIRKADVMMAASYYSNHKNEEYRKWANTMYSYIKNKLSICETKDTSRILAILMQNNGVGYFYTKETSLFSPIGSYTIRKSPVKYIKIVKLLFKSIVTFSPKSELKWLKFRFTKIAKLLSNN
jgi:hypothetical protein